MAKEKELKMPCNIYSRVCGYFQPVKNYNIGKKAEFYDRHTHEKYIEESLNAKEVNQRRGCSFLKSQNEVVTVSEKSYSEHRIFTGFTIYDKPVASVTIN